jgi:hypothetical protein
LDGAAGVFAGNCMLLAAACNLLLKLLEFADTAGAAETGLFTVGVVGFFVLFVGGVGTFWYV